jgi:hypothetical protein
MRPVKDISSPLSSFLLLFDLLPVWPCVSISDGANVKSLKSTIERTTGSLKVTEQNDALCAARKLSPTEARDRQTEILSLSGSLKAVVQNIGSDRTSRYSDMLIALLYSSNLNVHEDRTCNFFVVILQSDHVDPSGEWRSYDLGSKCNWPLAKVAPTPSPNPSEVLIKIQHSNAFCCRIL